jgi:GEVED domain/Fibronectin type III domain
MLKKILFAIALTTYGVISAQTTVIDPTGDGGFETGATLGANGWSDNMLPLTAPTFHYWNRWVTNTAATGYTGARAAYITNDIDGTPVIPPYAYSAPSSVIPKIHRIVAFPAGETDITLNFDWKGEADADDFLRIWLVPTGDGIPNGAYTPAAGRNLIGSYNNQANWTNTTITIPATYANTSSRLVFEWFNNATIGTTPAAIDNISLVTDILCGPNSTNSTYFIDRFQTYVGGSSDIVNSNSGYATSGYEDNTATDSVEQFAGAEVNFATVLNSGTFGVNIWVDWDGDGDFLSNPNEKVFATNSYTTSFISDFTIPNTIAPGSYVMRVRADYYSIDPTPCGVISDGETEDYTLIVSPITCTNDPTIQPVTNIDAYTATINWSAASPVPAEGYDYFVTINPNPISYNQTPTGNTTATSIDLTGLLEDTTYYVWVRSVCSTTWGGDGAWVGSETFTTLIAAPTTTSVSICPGDPSEVLTADASCTNNAVLGNTIVGETTLASPLAYRLYWATTSGNPCSFDTTEDQERYETFDFQVDAAGTYIFTVNETTPFDSMGYIVFGGFTPGDCSGGGTYVAGDDDSADTGLDSKITAVLTPGITYTLVTTFSGFSSPDIGPFQWDVTGPGTLLDPYTPTNTLGWYTTASGGTPIFTGDTFDLVAEGIITDTNTTGSFTYWVACSATPALRTPATYNIGKVWTGAIDSDWNTAGNWSPSGIPTDTDCVVITNAGFSPIVNGTTDGVGGRLIVQNGATLTQQSNSILTFDGAITVDTGGTYTMLDSASLFQETDVANTVNGTFNMQRTATISEDDYVYWSSPVDNFLIQNVSPGTIDYNYEWLPTLNQGPGPVGIPTMFFGEWQSYNTGAMDVGKGYIVKGPVGHGSTDAPFTATFSGTPNNGSITQPIERGTHNTGLYTFQPYAGGDILNITDDDDNWNLIGNPYPSAISLEDFISDNGTIDGFVYLWTHGTDIGIGNTDSFYDDFTYNYNVADYIAINSVGVSNPTGFDRRYIGAGQGFFVLMNDSGTTNENVEFHNYMRRADGFYRNDLFFRSANTDIEEEDAATKHRIWLDYVTPSGGTNTTLIGYVNGATNDKDRMYDAKTTRGEGLNLYSLLDEDTYIIQGRQTPFVNTDTVPLGLNITEAGIQTIAINTVDGLFLDTDQDIYIEDATTGITHNLNNAPYTFTSDAVGNVNDRFILTYRASTLSIEDFDILNVIKVYEESETIVVTSSQETIASIEVYDMLGRTLFNKRSINSDRFTINNISPDNATLIVKVKLVNGQQKIAKMIF